MTNQLASSTGAGGRQPAPSQEPAEVRLSLCTIARDEAENLAIMLEVMKELVDEIVVVDTGSQDNRTLDVARRFGAIAGHHTWTDDFAAARNAALDLATGDWVLFLDADERFREAIAGAMRRFINGAPEAKKGELSFTGYCPVYRQAQQDELGRNHLAFEPRLFPRHPSIRWIDALYERPVIVGGEGQLVWSPASQLTIVHLGHPNDPARAQGKRERNRRIIEKGLRQTPDQPFPHMVAGRELLAQRQFAAAAEHLERAALLSHVRPPAFMHHGYVFLVTALSESGELDKAIDYGLDGLRFFPEADLDCVVALAYLMRDRPGDLDQALRHFQRARSLNTFGGTKPGDQDALTWKPLWGMGHIYERRGLWERALIAYEEALRYVPDDPAIRRQAAVALRKIGHAADACEHLRRAIASMEQSGWGEPDLQAARGALAETLREAGRIQEAYDYLVELIERSPDTLAYRITLADLLIEAGEYVAAANALSPALDGDRPAPLAVYHRLGEALSRLGNYEDAANAFQIAVSIDPTDARSQQGLAAARQQLVS